MSDNLALWCAIEKTPPDQTKPITGKAYSGTSPKPYYIVRKATETFGPIGIGWGYSIVNERIEDAGGEKLHIALVRVWYIWDGKRGEVEHIGATPFSGTRKSGAGYLDEDAPKKSVTDALVKALSMIGFAGDIFMGRYDDSKYVAELRDEARQSAANDGASRLVAEYQDRIRAIANPDALVEWWNGPERKKATQDFGLSQAEMDVLKGAVIARKAELDGKVRAA